jgi:hypothetical protein
MKGSAMPNSSRGRTGLPGRSGTVTVIEEPVRRNYARMAKVAFYVVAIIAGLLAALILSAMLSAPSTILLGILIGVATGAVAWTLVRAWPVLRVIWWWLPEITVAAAFVTGWLELVSCTGLLLRTVVVVLVLGVPAAIGPVRRWIIALGWCLISRHRIRTCFSEFIITNRYGTLPLILGARPTPAGERLWIWLRPGLSVKDIQDRAEQIATACWSSSVVIDRASPSNAAFVRIDVKRRDPLTAVIDSPLKARLPWPILDTNRETPVVPTALDLTDVTADEVTTAGARRPNAVPPRKWPDAPAAALTGTVTGPEEYASSDDPEDDISDYI